MAQHDCHRLLRFRIGYQKLPSVHEKHAAARVLATEGPRDLPEHLPARRHELERAILAKAKLESTVLDGALLDDADLSDALFESTSFVGARGARDDGGPAPQCDVPSDRVILFQTLYLPTGLRIGSRLTSSKVRAS